jgi:hypothetical protein
VFERGIWFPAFERPIASLAREESVNSAA